MAFGDRVKNLIGNLGQGDWYLGKNLNMERGQALQILLAGGPAAAALKFALRERGVTDAQINQAYESFNQPSKEDLEDWARKQGYGKKQDMTPLYIGMGVLAFILITKK
jgi:hypothetical protein